ncbi:MAG: serine/threonine protein kinase [Alphaproteobacteria bacterium]|nr:serine/threonine protein kinase [Alphaproteobacteria bacterium]
MPPKKPDPYIGKLFADRFLILDVLGEGSMGTVYEAREVNQQRPAAVKMIHKHLAMHKRISDRFRREMELTAAIESPYVVKAYDYGQAPGGELYLAMEFIDGRPLNAVIAKAGRLDVSRAVDIAVQLCHALADAHRRGIIHRDIKPENVMLIETAEGQEEVRILDFGVARLVDTSGEDEGSVQNTMTRAGSPLGTLPYMSPQQIACEPLDFRTDLYSLGIVLYEMLAGKPPFHSATRKQALQDHLFKQPPPIREANPAVTAGLAMVIDALLAKEPEDRPRSADEVIQRLRASTPRRSRAELFSSATMVPDLTDPPLDLPTQETAVRLPSNLAAVPDLNRSMSQSKSETMVPDADDEETMLLPPIDHQALADARISSNLAGLAQAPPPPAPAPEPDPIEPERAPPGLGTELPITEPLRVTPTRAAPQEPAVYVAPDAASGAPSLGVMVAIAVSVAFFGMLAGAGVMWLLLR